MRTISRTIVSLMLIFYGVLNAQDRTDFAGEWKLNTEKSEMGGGPGGGRGGRGATKMTVIQEEDTLIVEATSQNRDGEDVINKSTYNLDGTDSKNSARFGERISQIEWSKDGKTFTIFSEMTMSRGGREFTMDTEEDWSIEEGMLIIETTRSTPRGDMTSKAAYDRIELK